MGPSATAVDTATPGASDRSAPRAEAASNEADAASDAQTPRLTPEQIGAIAAANRCRRPIRQAVAVAAFNGWSTAVFAALTVPFALFSPTALIMGLGLGAIAFFEFKGRRLLQRFDTKAPAFLGFNQIAFAALIIGYCAWSIYANMNSPGRYAETIAANPELTRMLGPIGDLHKTITLAVYGAVAFSSLLFQGSMAVYYFTRSRHLRACLTGTPEWVLDIQRATATA